VSTRGGSILIPGIFVKRLEGLGPRFLRVSKKGKEPIDKGWKQPERLMSVNDSRLKEWLSQGGNYGVAAGRGLVILDADNEEIKQCFKCRLPPTFTVESPGSGGWHCYFLCDLEKAIRLRDKDGENVGDVQGDGKMVVGPGSVHPNGGRYEIVQDVPISQITEEQLRGALSEYIVPEQECHRIEELAFKEREHCKVDLRIEQVISLAGFRRRGDEYFGSHPVHGSKTGRNFSVNRVKNVWHCFRHGTGGGPLLWIAVEEGYLRCEDAISGALRSDLFKQAYQKAVDRGLIKSHENGARIRKAKPPRDVTRVSGISREGLYEAIYDNDTPAFLVLSDGKFSILTEVHEGNIVIKPPTKEECPYPPYRYYSGDIDVSELAREVHNEFKAFADAEESYKQRWTTETFLTYVQHKLSTMPYEFLVGMGDAGKTAVLNVMSILMYRAMCGTSFPGADIYSYLAIHNPGTILEDEIQGIEKDREKLKIYNTGYKDGARVPRIFDSPNGHRSVKYFPTYGFKACASKHLPRGPQAEAFLERFIISHMMEGWPQKDEVKKEDIERMLTLRDKLLKWRMLTYDQELPDVNPQVKGRLKELWKPLLQLAAVIGSTQQIQQALTEEYQSRRVERETSLDASILRTVLSSMKESDKEWISFDTIWTKLTSLLDGNVDPYHPSKFHSSEHGDITKWVLGNRLKDVLGAERKAVRHGAEVAKAYKFSEDKLIRAVKRFICNQVTNLRLVMKGNLHVEFFCPCLAGLKKDSGICTNNTVAPEGNCKLGNLVTGSSYLPSVQNGDEEGKSTSQR